MQRHFKWLAIFTCLVLTVGCGSKKSDSNGGNGSGTPNHKVLSGDVKVENGNLVGTGKIIFNQSLETTEEQKTFYVNFQLKNEGDLVAVNVFADNNLGEGLDFQFVRKGDVIEAKVNGEALGSGTLQPDASGGLNMSIEVHNNEKPTAHIIVKSGGNVVEDSAGGKWKRGTGKFWGLTLETAVVSDAKVGEAENPH